MTRLYMLAGDSVVVHDGPWSLRAGSSPDEEVLTLHAADGDEEHDVLAWQGTRWNHGVFAAHHARTAFFVDVTKRVTL